MTKNRSPNSGTIPVVDLFAGPGGLGEGFSTIRDRRGNSVFSDALSIEMDHYAYRTLLLRKLFRSLRLKSSLDKYYDYIRGATQGASTLEQLFGRLPAYHEAVRERTWRITLGEEPSGRVDDRIRQALGSATGRTWVLIGGPPCQAYSLVGRVRSFAEHGEKFYDDHKHLLYKEYLRILREHVPTVFVMENVKGLLSSRLRDGTKTFDLILNDLQAPLPRGGHYNLFCLSTGGLRPFCSVPDFVVKAEDYGLPQSRHRVIIIGIHSDLSPDLENASGSGDEPLGPSSVRDAIGEMPKLRSGVRGEGRNGVDWHDCVQEVLNCKWLRDIADDQVKQKVRSAATVAAASSNGRGGRFVECDPGSGPLCEWLVDARLDGVCNHEARGHMKEDLYRYLFASSFASVLGRSPRLEDFPESLLPKHKNVGVALDTGLFCDRFRVQLADAPSTTITSHIAKDGHYFIHHDPEQVRSLTVREAARLQTFPDNYFFEGPRTEQYRQVGNAVPPLLARMIASVVFQLCS